MPACEPQLEATRAGAAAVYRIAGRAALPSRALLWSGAGQLLRQMTQVGAMILLARILHPADVGLMSLVMTVIGFVGLFTTLGTLPAIVQAEALTGPVLCGLFWSNVLISGVIGLSLAAGAGWIALALRQPALDPMIQALAASLVLAAVAGFYQALLQRRMDFRTLARLEILSTAAGAAAAVAAARLGLGPGCLVAQLYTMSVVSIAGGALATRWFPRERCGWAHMRAFRRFGVNLTAFNLLNYLARNADNVIVGRVLGATALGYYGTAYRSLVLPIQASSGIAGRVLFPVLSRLRPSPRLAREAYQGAVGLIAFATFPLMMAGLVAADWVVETILGVTWLPVVPVLRILTPVGMFQSLVSLEGSIYLASGRTELMFRVGAAIAVLYVGSFFLGVRWGIVGVAACYAAADALATVPALHFSLGLIGMRPLELLAGVARTALCSLLMAATLWSARAPLSAHSHGIARLAAVCAIGLSSYLFWSALFNRRQCREVLELTRSIRRVGPRES